MKKVWFRKQTGWWYASIKEGGTYRQFKLVKAPNDKDGRKLAEAQLIQEFAGHGVRLAAIGVLCGAVAAYPLTRFLQTLLYQVKPADPLTWAAVIPALFAAAALASWIPARRTVRVDPTEALRSE